MVNFPIFLRNRSLFCHKSLFYDFSEELVMVSSVQRKLDENHPHNVIPCPEIAKNLTSEFLANSTSFLCKSNPRFSKNGNLAQN